MPEDMKAILWKSADKLRSQAKQPEIGAMIDAAMDARENPSLRGKLDKRFGRAQLNRGVLGELIDLFSTVGLGEKHNGSDLLGEVYEYFRTVYFGRRQKGRTVLYTGPYGQDACCGFGADFRACL